MNVGPGDHRSVSDDDVREALRAHYAPPREESYWNALERTVMARIQSDTAVAREWWSHFGAWARVGVAAAAAALLVASAAAWRTRVERERMAYRELLDTPSTLPILSETLGSDSTTTARNATLRYLLMR
jgi:hypothetical protein